MLPVLLAAVLTATPDSCLSTSREFTVRVLAGHTIAAVLETRSPGLKRPAVVLISGAGAHTRDYSTALSDDTSNQAFAALSRRLVDAGFAVVRFDERGTGKSSGDYERTATTATLAEDVGALLFALGLRAEIDASRIALVGHSDRGASAALVAAHQPRVGAIALLSSPSWNGRRIMDWQDEYAVRFGSWPSAFAAEESRREWLATERQRRMTTESWFPYFLDYEPLPAIRHVRAPVLILHGDADTQVTPEQARDLERAARESGNPDVTLHVLPGHSHGLVDPAEAFPEPLTPLVGDRLVEWLATIFRHQPRPLTCGAASGAT